VEGALTPEKQKLLALRLRQKAARLWFPYVGDAPRRLFCFPHAGGGAAPLQAWRSRFAGRLAVCPARLPGRENRLDEAPAQSMQELAGALADAIAPHLGVPFAFFGHSMGAVIAFELARELRRRKRKLPCALVVSAARAPQLRLGYVPPPEPSEEQLLEELRRLEGVPPGVLDSPEALRLALPVLRADTRLFRNYVYSREEPLAAPMLACGGESDPNVRPAHLEAWREQTSSDFLLRLYPGGHFYLQTAPDEFFSDLLRMSYLPEANRST
jgi:surfactin synthase thioesterase subunit